MGGPAQHANVNDIMQEFVTYQSEWFMQYIATVTLIDMK